MKSSITTFLLLIVTVSFGQATKTDPREGQGWYGAGVSIDLPKKWNLSLDYEARFQNNLKDYYGSYFSIELENKLHKYFTAIGEYRLAKFDDGVSHRFSFGGSSEMKLAKKTKLSSRILFLNRVWDDIDPTLTNEKSLFWRFRIGLEYGLMKKMDLYAATEPIMEFGGDSFIDNWRNTIGFKYKIYKKTTLNVFYIYRPDYRKASYNRYYNIFGVNFKYNIKVKSKK
jgi:hypothetical protein